MMTGRVQRSLLAAGMVALAMTYAPQAEASLVLNTNANGVGSYTVDSGPTVSDNGTLRPDPSSTIGVNVLTFAVPAGQTSSPGDVLIYDPTNTTLIADFRFTDAAGDLSGVHGIDRAIFYSIARAGNPADTGLPSNAGSGTSIRVQVNASGFVSYVTTPNVYNLQTEFIPAAGVPEPPSLVLSGLAAGLALAFRRFRGRKTVA